MVGKGRILGKLRRLWQWATHELRLGQPWADCGMWSSASHTRSETQSLCALLPRGYPGPLLWLCWWDLSSGEDGLSLGHGGNVRAVSRGRVCWGASRFLTIPCAWTSQGDAVGSSHLCPEPRGTATGARSWWPHWLDQQMGTTWPLWVQGEVSDDLKDRAECPG